MEGKKRLTEGEHSLRIEYYQGGGGKALSFKYKGADTDGNKVLVGGATLKAIAGGNARPSQTRTLLQEASELSAPKKLLLRVHSTRK